VPLLTAGHWYVVQSEAEFFLIASPAKLVVIQYEQGPLRIKGLFSDGEGQVETRTYSSKFLAIVDAAAGQSGKVELIAIPAGVNDEGSITRRLVDIGVAPQPPPGPGPDPQPDPTPDPEPSVDTFKAEVKNITTAKNPPVDERPKVAAAFRAIAAEIDSGAITTREQLTHRTSDTIVERIGLNAFLTNWVPWRDDLTAVLKRQNLTTVKSHATPWNQIADVLEGK